MKVKVKAYPGLSPRQSLIKRTLAGHGTKLSVKCIYILPITSAWKEMRKGYN